MKIIITLLLTFMFVSNVYAENYSSSTIMGEGKIISIYHTWEYRQVMITYEVYYKDKIFTWMKKFIIILSLQTI